MSLKRSNLEPKLLQCLYKLVYGLSIGDKVHQSPMVIGELWSTFPGSKIFPQQISCTLFVGAQRNLAVLGVWPIETYSPNLVNFDTRR